MAEEQIVTFETAKLLQEKSFEGQWRKVYSLRSGNLLELSSDNREQFIPAPTQEVVCQWIRQKHQLHIEISVSPIVGKIKDDFNGPKYARTGTISDWYESKDFVRCQVSEMIDIASEWRVIVFNGEIQHVGNYSGDCLVFPDGEAIRNMVKAYGEAAPKAWTLDVAVTTDGKTVVLDYHRFFSCGLYGYADYRRIPKMYSQCWREMLTIR